MSNMQNSKIQNVEECAFTFSCTNEQNHVSVNILPTMMLNDLAVERDVKKCSEVSDKGFPSPGHSVNICRTTTLLSLLGTH